MSRNREWDITCKVYIGNLGNSARRYDLELAFAKYGPLKNIWVARNPPGFAFIEFDHPRDAENAVRALDGTHCCNSKIKVQMASRRNHRDGGSGRRFGSRYSRSRSLHKKSGSRYGRSWSRSPKRSLLTRISRSRSHSPRRRSISRSRSRDRRSRSNSRSNSRDRRY